MFGVKVGLTYGVSPFYSATVGKFTTILLYVYMIYFGLQTITPVLTNETKALVSELRREGALNEFNPANPDDNAEDFILAFGFLNKMPDNYGTFKF